eukprot:TRINITY_DN11460_c0_g2_i1.p1 TRINITY_DN11460_c0_g2~~TRINITY_DN11460_c0_g2_i1.p1  ORF type:complete len:4295 (+),score=806.94 TRINITY_DN11460_c0_g2_i1:51-12935(+)
MMSRSKCAVWLFLAHLLCCVHFQQASGATSCTAYATASLPSISTSNCDIGDGCSIAQAVGVCSSDTYSTIILQPQVAYVISTVVSVTNDNFALIGNGGIVSLSVPIAFEISSSNVTFSGTTFTAASSSTIDLSTGSFLSLSVAATVFENVDMNVSCTAGVAQLVDTQFISAGGTFNGFTDVLFERVLSTTTGAIMIISATVTVSQSSFINNVAGCSPFYAETSENFGGSALAIQFSQSLTMIDNMFRGNAVSCPNLGSALTPETHIGGAVFAVVINSSAALLLIQNCTFSENWISSPNPQASNIVVAGGAAMAISIDNFVGEVALSLTLVNSSFDSNYVYSPNGNAFHGNSFVGGAALRVHGYSEVAQHDVLFDVSGSTFTNNSVYAPNLGAGIISLAGGGALATSSSGTALVILTNNTFARNTVNAAGAYVTGTESINHLGGGAIIVDCSAIGTAYSGAILVGNVFTDNSVSADNARSVKDNDIGGGAVHVSARSFNSTANVTFKSQRNMYISNSASVKNAFAPLPYGAQYVGGGQNFIGGGSVFMLSLAATLANISSDTKGDVHMFNSANGSNATAAYNYVGGGAVSVLAVSPLVTAFESIDVTGVYMNNSLIAVNCVASSFNHGGGGAVRLLEEAHQTSFFNNTIIGSVYLSNFVNVTASIAPFSSKVGGGALYIGAFALNGTGSSTSNVVGITATSNQVSADDAYSSSSDATGCDSGGGAIFVHGEGYFLHTMSITVRSSNFTDNSVSSLRSISVTGNQNGGGAVFFYCQSFGMSYLNAHITTSNFVSNGVVSANNQATGRISGNQNGGGAIFVHGEGYFLHTMSITVRSSNFTDNSVSSLRSISVTGNQNGGGAVFFYCQSFGMSYLNAHITTSNFVSNGVVSANNQATGRISGNQNGGGAVYLYAQATYSATAFIRTTHSTFFNNRLIADNNTNLADGSSYYYGNNNGGGAVFVFSRGDNTSSVQNHLTHSVFSNNVLSANSNNGIFANNNGGGAVYVYSFSGQNSTLLSNVTDCKFQTNVASTNENSVNQGSKAQNTNGGGALFLVASSDLAAALTTTVVSSTMANNSALAARNSAAFNNNGGGALYVFCVGLQGNTSVENSVLNSQFTDNSVLVAEQQAEVYNQNGGGAIYAFSEGFASLLVSEIQASNFSNNMIDAANNTGHSCSNGGGAVFVMSTASLSSLTSYFSNSSFANNAAIVDGNNATHVDLTNYGNAGGGGALYLFGYGRLEANTFVSVSGCTLADNTVSVDDCTSVQSNNNGGAGLYVFGFSVQNANVDTQIVSSVFSGHTVSAVDSASVLVNSNGGGAVYLSGVCSGQCSMDLAVTESNFTDNAIMADNALSRLNSNGGGAMYLSVTGEIVSLTTTNIKTTFKGQTASARTNLALKSADLTTTSSNSNGGGAMYIFAHGTSNSQIDSSMSFCTFDSNQVLVDGCFSPLLNNNGGGSLYVLAVSDNANVSANIASNHSRYINNSVSVSQNVGDDNLIGGGAVYAQAFADTKGANAELTIQIDANDFSNNRVLSTQAVAAAIIPSETGFNANGGGALYAYAQAPLFSKVGGLVSSSAFTLNSVECDNSVALKNSFNGGGAVYVFARALFDGTTSIDSIVSVDILLCDFDANSVSSNNGVVQTSDSGGLSENGGGAIYMLAYSPANGTLPGFSTVSSNVNNCRFSANSVVANNVTATFGASQGGGGLYAVSAGSYDSILAMELSDCVFDSNSVVGSGNQAELVLNGGGAVYLVGRSLYGDVDFSVSSTNDAYINNAVLSSDNTATFSNNNGGGAIMAFAVTQDSRANINAQTANSTFANNSVIATDNLLPMGLVNANGGGAVQLFALSAASSLTLTVTSTEFTFNSLSADGSTAVGLNATTAESISNNNNGGGALYALSMSIATEGKMNAVVENCSLTSNAAVTNNNIAYAGNNTNGGGGIYLFVWSAVDSMLNATVRNSVFTNNLVVSNNSTANSSVANGGGGLYAFAYGLAATMQSVLSSSTFINNSIVSNSAFAQEGNSNGGGAAFLYSSGVSPSYHDGQTFEAVAGLTVQNCVFAGNSATASNNSAPTLSNENGGGALYVYGFHTGNCSVTAVIQESSFISNSADCRDNLSPSGNDNGGGAVYINSEGGTTATLNASLLSVQSERNLALLSDNIATEAANENGGGSVYMYTFATQSSLVANIDASTFVGDSVYVTSGVSIDGSNDNGGGAVYLFSESTSGDAAVEVSASSTQFTANTAVIASMLTTLTGGNNNGGGALFALADGAGVSRAHLQLVNVTATNNSVVTDFNVGGAGNNNGGGAMFIFSEGTAHAATGIASANSTFVGNYVSSVGNIGNFSTFANSGNQNGGGAVYVFANAFVSASVYAHVDTSTFTSNSVFAGGDLSLDSSNNNGGGALYIVSQATNDSSTCDSFIVNCVFVGNFVDTSNNSAVGAGASNQNGGGALFLFSLGESNCTMSSSVSGTTFVGNHALMNSAQATSGNFNGGGAAFLFADTVRSVAMVSNVVVASRFENNMVRSIFNTAGGNYIGGGAWYVFCLSPVASLVSNFMSSSFVNNQLLLSNVTALAALQGNQNGGGAVYILASAAQVAWTASSVASCSFVYNAASLASNIALNASNNNGGGAMYAFCSSQSSQSKIQDTMIDTIFTGNVFEASDMSAPAVTGNNQAGGGAAYIFAGAPLASSVTQALRNCSFSFNTVTATNTNSLQDISNGGGALYIYAYASGLFGISSLVQTSTMCSFVENALLVRDSVCVSNNNGGGAIFMLSSANAVANAQFSMLNGTARSNQAGIYNTQSQANRNGGAAVYIFTLTVGTSALSVAIQQSSFVENSASVANNTALNANQNGGGALYVVALTPEFNVAPAGVSVSQLSVRVALSESVFDGNSAFSAGGVSAAGSFLGGGAVYTLARAFQPASILNITVENCVLTNSLVTVQSSVCTQNSDFSGGGALYALSRSFQLATSAVVNLRSTSFTNNSCSLHGISASQNNFDGGGAVYMLASSVGPSPGTVQHVAYNCSFLQNSAWILGTLSSNDFLGGGAVYVLAQSLNSTNLFVQQSETILTGNSALLDSYSSYLQGGGGAVYIVSPTTQNPVLALTSDLCTYSQNSIGGTVSMGSSLGGGALFVVSFASAYGTDRNALAVTISNSTLVSNMAMKGNGGALAVHAQTATLVSCFVENNVASLGGAVYADVGTDVVTPSCQFIGNSASSGGAVYSLGDVSSQNTTYAANRASSFGGGLWISTGNAVLADTTFINNIGVIGGGIHITDGTLLMSNVVCSLNVAEEGGAIMTNGGSQITVHGTTFEQNSASFGAAFGLTGQVVLQLLNADFRANVATKTHGGALYLEGTTKVVAQDCVFDSNSALLFGGAAMIREKSVLTVINSTFSQNSAAVGGCIDIQDLGSVTATNTSFVSCSASSYAGTVSVEVASSFECLNCTIVGSYSSGAGGAVSVSTNASATFAGCVVAHNRGASGGFVDASNFAQVNVAHCAVIGNSATTSNGGAFSFSDSSELVVTFSNISGNIATVGSGGAVAFQSTQPLLGHWTDVMLTNNTAQRGGGVYLYGGAISPDRICNPHTASSNESVVVTRNIAVGNSNGTNSLGGGGGVYWDLSEATDPTVIGCVLLRATAQADYFNNSAVYGQNAASTPVYVSISTDQLNLTPGVTSNIQVAVLDAFGHVVTTLSKSLVSVQCDTCTIINTFSVVTNGYANVALDIPGSVGSSQQLTFSVEGSESLANLTTYFILGNCPDGSGLSLGRCVPCGAGQYTLNVSQPCQACPAENAHCSGSTAVYIDNNYWPLINNTAGTFDPLLCPFDYCARGQIGDNPAGDAALFNVSQWCREGSNRDGDSPLCGACLPGYSEWNNQCLPCEQADAKTIVLKLLEIVALTLLQVIVSQRTQTTAAFKILVFTLQTASLAFYPAIATAPLLGLFNFQLPSFLESNHCPFPMDAYSEVGVRMALPVMYYVMLVLIFFVHNLLLKILGILGHRGWQRARWLVSVLSPSARVHAYAKTGVVMFITLFQGIMQTVFYFLNCQSLLGVVYLFPTVHCTTAHYQWVKVVLVLVMVVLCAAPAIVGLRLFYLMYRFKSLESVPHWLIVYFAEFRPEFCWWESYMLLRRVLVLAVFTSLITAPNTSSRAGLSVVLFAQLVLQLVVRPFRNNLDNYFEVFSLAMLLSILTMDQLDSAWQSTMSTVLLAIVAIVLLTPTAWNVVRTLRRWIAARVKSSRQSRVFSPLALDSTLDTPLLDSSEDSKTDIEMQAPARKLSVVSGRSMPEQLDSGLELPSLQLRDGPEMHDML